MADFTPKYQLYKWKVTDSKQDTINESSNNAEKTEQILSANEQIVNDAKTIAQGAETKANSVETTANSAVMTAAEAKTKAETVQSQFNLVVAEAGENNPEVVQARGTSVNLNDRLNGVDSQLAQTIQEGIENGGRSAVMYRDANSVYLSGKSFVLSGFRFRGQYLRAKAPFVTFTSDKIVASLTTDLGCQTTKDLNNWYAAFAVNDNGVAKVKVMPFFSVQAVNGNIITLSEAGENRNTSTIKTYSMNTNVLLNSDVLVVTERLGTSNYNAFSGRISKVAANTNQSITVDNIGTIGVGDWLLCSPPGFSDYRYLASFYLDAAEVRNIFDSGLKVTTRGVAITTVAIDGDMTTGKYVDVQGYIPPLASAVICQIKQTLSTASTGTFNISLGGDDAHSFIDKFSRKDITGTLVTYESGIEAPFQFGQKTYFKSSGGVHASATRQFDIRGWIEP